MMSKTNLKEYFYNSSYLFDLKYALNSFDERVSFGSDWPYISHHDAISVISSNIMSSSKYSCANHPVWGDNLKNFIEL